MPGFPDIDRDQQTPTPLLEPGRNPPSTQRAPKPTFLKWMRQGCSPLIRTCMQGPEFTHFQPTASAASAFSEIYGARGQKSLPFSCQAYFLVNVRNKALILFILYSFRREPLNS